MCLATGYDLVEVRTSDHANSSACVGDYNARDPIVNHLVGRNDLAVFDVDFGCLPILNSSTGQFTAERL